MDYTLILIAVALAVFVFFQYRSSKRRQREAAERLESLVPGVEVMTNFGLYGTLVSMDDEENLAFIEIAPKTIVKVHKQVVLKAVEQDTPDEEAEESVERTEGSDAEGADEKANIDGSQEAPVDEPEFGERTKGTKKPARKKSGSDSE